ncbi:iron-sulfur cluster repair di-iron protein [Niastella populi]|uniref:iron-sulfur cluster repair di-iron protein n=1 Tax=Niastella populi TaxID=550983 RepID=UPI0009BF55F1|nr:iron-sulfur cluster repair di-iron protein [Niastella populi]
MLEYKNHTLAAIVSDRHQAAAVFEKYHLDFCCKGKRTLQDACAEKNIPVEPILEELQQVFEPGSGVEDQLLATMSVSQLSDYIVLKHHIYVKHAMPVIYEHLNRVAAKHGDRFSYMQQVFNLFSTLQTELDAHMQKEEMVLFPRIKEVEKALEQKNNQPALNTGYINSPIHMMETEHEEAGELLAQIRRLTNDYTPPADACATFRISLAELKSFEEDLHRHIHLENNLLFPRIVKMMQ